MKRLYYLYVALAVFMLGTAGFELLIGRRVTKMSFERLRQLATGLDAPADAMRMERAFTLFEDRIIRLLDRLMAADRPVERSHVA